MKKQRPAKKKQEAPAYMAQFAALMTILLAFFILLLTMGKEKTGGLQSGVGNIRNAIGLIGGSGMLEFWRSMRSPGLPAAVSISTDDDAQLIGYDKETLDRFILPAEEIHKIDFIDHRHTLLLRSSIRFEPERIAVRRDTRFALDHAFALLYTLKSYHITVGVVAEGGDPEKARLLAAQRAAWLARHIRDQSPTPVERIRSLGIARNGLGKEEEEETPAEVVFLLRKKNLNKTTGD